jgi:hypothetical protein
MLELELLKLRLYWLSIDSFRLSEAAGVAMFSSAFFTITIRDASIFFFKESATSLPRGPWNKLDSFAFTIPGYRQSIASK